MGLKPVTSVKLDGDAERVRADHAAAITTLQQTPGANASVISNVSLANGQLTPVAHRLGHAPSFVTASIPRGATSAGYIVESRPSTGDRSKFVYLTATGYGATIAVDLWVAP